MRLFLSICLSLLPSLCFTQTKDSTDVESKEIEITTPPYWSSCESEPDSLKLICSEEAILDYILENIHVPSHLFENLVVQTSFDISPKGEITNIKTFECDDDLVNQEVSRLLNTMPNWTPGYSGSEAIKVRYMIPIHFVPVKVRD